MILINELNILLVCLVENYSHHCLPTPHWTINLCVYWINRYRITFLHKCIKNIFTKLFSLNDYFFALWMNLSIKGCQCIYSICFFSNSWWNWYWSGRLRRETGSYPYRIRRIPRNRRDFGRWARCWKGYPPSSGCQSQRAKFWLSWLISWLFE